MRPRRGYERRRTQFARANSVRNITVTIGAIALLAGCGVSTQQEVQMGQDEAQQVNAQLPMVQDAQIQNYINALGNRIARTTSRSDLNWQFQVVNSDVVNAFALPGGFVYVNRGVLARASNMSEVAGVLGHEIEHVVKRHSVKQMEQVQTANVGVGILCALTGVCQSGVARRRSTSVAPRSSRNSAAPTRYRPTRAASTMSFAPGSVRAGCTLSSRSCSRRSSSRGAEATQRLGSRITLARRTASLTSSGC